MYTYIFMYICIYAHMHICIYAYICSHFGSSGSPANFVAPPSQLTLAQVGSSGSPANFAPSPPNSHTKTLEPPNSGSPANFAPSPPNSHTKTLEPRNSPFLQNSCTKRQNAEVVYTKAAGRYLIECHLLYIFVCAGAPGAASPIRFYLCRRPMGQHLLCTFI